MNVGALLFSFNGRANRATWWLTFLIFLILCPVLAFAQQRLSKFGGIDFLSFGLGLGVNVVALYSWIAVSCKRLHDRDKSGWWLILLFVMPTVLLAVGTMLLGAFKSEAGLACLFAALGIVIWAIIELGGLRGTAGANQYGPDPREAQAAPR